MNWFNVGNIWTGVPIDFLMKIMGFSRFSGVNSPSKNHQPNHWSVIDLNDSLTDVITPMLRRNYDSIIFYPSFVEGDTGIPGIPGIPGYLRLKYDCLSSSLSFSLLNKKELDGSDVSLLFLVERLMIFCSHIGQYHAAHIQPNTDLSKLRHVFSQPKKEKNRLWLW